MSVLPWIAVVMVGAGAGWCLAAFVLRWRQDGRCWATVLLPAVSVMIGTYLYLSGPGGVDPLWRVVFGLASVVAGSMSVLVTLPIWFLIESCWGYRAP